MPPQDEWLSSRRFGIVIDAGSSGSRLQIYSWKDPRTALPSQAHLLPLIEKGSRKADDWQVKTEPGISSYSNDPESVSTHLAPLLAHARQHIPPSVESLTPLYILATAGMRLLPAEAQTALLEQTCQFLRNHSNFIVEDPSDAGPCGSSVRIITGEEEGLFGWIAVNYLMGGFTSGVHNRHSETFGFLDMGGASAQIAFEPDVPFRQKDQGLFDVHLRRLGGDDIYHQVFVTTWLGFGSNQARERYLASVTASDRSLGQIADPCLPKSLSTIENTHSSPTHDIHLHGTGSFSECLQATLPILNKDIQCNTKHSSINKCMFNGVSIPPIEFAMSHFVGVSEYWYSSEQVFGLGGEWDYPRFERKAEEFCGREWAGLSEEFDVKFDHYPAAKKAMEMERLQMQCFKSAWVANVLHEGIGMPRVIDLNPEVTTAVGESVGEDASAIRKKPRFQSVDTVDGMSISWTLGKMVIEASKEVPTRHKPSVSDVKSPLKPGPPEEHPEDVIGSPLPFNQASFDPALVLFYIMALLALFSLLYRFRWHIRITYRRFRRNGNQSLRLEEGFGTSPLNSKKRIRIPKIVTQARYASNPSSSRPQSSSMDVSSSNGFEKSLGLNSGATPLRASPTRANSFPNGSQATNISSALLHANVVLAHSSSRSPSPVPSQTDSNGLTSGQLTPRSRNGSQMSFPPTFPMQPSASRSYHQGANFVSAKLTRTSSTMSVKRED